MPPQRKDPASNNVTSQSKKNLARRHSAALCRAAGIARWRRNTGQNQTQRIARPPARQALWRHFQGIVPLHLPLDRCAHPSPAARPGAKWRPRLITRDPVLLRTSGGGPLRVTALHPGESSKRIEKHPMIIPRGCGSGEPLQRSLPKTAAPIHQGLAHRPAQQTPERRARVVPGRSR